MKNLLSALVVLLLIANTALAQTKKQARKDRVKAIKVAFITDELALTVEESQNFWVVYNEMEEKIKALHQENKGKKKVDKSTLSEAELEAWIENKLKKQEQRVAIKREYVAKFKKVIPLLKIAKLMDLERKFKKELLHSAKKRQGAANK